MGLVDLLLEGLVDYMLVKGLVDFSAVKDGDLVIDSALDGTREAACSSWFTVLNFDFYFRFNFPRCSAICLLLNFVAVGLVEMLDKLLKGLVDCSAVLDGDLVAATAFDVGLETTCSS